MGKVKRRYRVRGKKHPEGSRDISDRCARMMSYHMNTENVKRIVAELPNDVYYDDLDCRDFQYILWFKTEKDRTWFNMKYTHEEK